MDIQITQILDLKETAAAQRGEAELLLERARWAAESFRRLDRETTQRIALEVAQAAKAEAGHFAEWAVKETGFGVVAHKQQKNELTSLPFIEHYADHDFVNPRIDAGRRLIEIPKPAGVVLALAPSTNPIATINFKILSCLLTRNAVVFSPHPAARECSIAAIHHLARAAEAAGAPEAVIQVVERPTIPLIEELMRSSMTDVILATGGVAMVRAAYSSGNPAIGVGPGNAPVFVDATADLKRAAERIVASKSFDNSILCTNESVVITLEACADGLKKELERAGAHLASEPETEALRRFLVHERGFNVEAIGRDAEWIAREAGFKVKPRTRIILATIEQIGVGEPLSREKLCPVLGFYVAQSKAQAIGQSRALLRFMGRGHTAAIHSQDPQTILDFAGAVEAGRIVVNAPASQGAAGFGTHLAPTFTIGTGYFGRSSIAENIGPEHLVQWTKVAFNDDPAERMADFSATRLRFAGPLPEAPSDGVPGKGRPRPAVAASLDSDQAQLREEIRRIIVEELRAALKS